VFTALVHKFNEKKEADAASMSVGDQVIASHHPNAPLRACLAQLYHL
jgi:hypothetical protein